MPRILAYACINLMPSYMNYTYMSKHKEFDPNPIHAKNLRGDFNQELQYFAQDIPLRMPKNWKIDFPTLLFFLLGKKWRT